MLKRVSDSKQSYRTSAVVCTSPTLQAIDEYCTCDLFIEVFRHSDQLGIDVECFHGVPIRAACQNPIERLFKLYEDMVTYCRC